MSKSEYFDGVKKIEYDDFQNPEFCAWFFAECSRLAYRPKLKGAKDCTNTTPTKTSRYD